MAMEGGPEEEAEGGGEGEEVEGGGDGGGGEVRGERGEVGVGERDGSEE